MEVLKDESDHSGVVIRQIQVISIDQQVMRDLLLQGTECLDCFHFIHTQLGSHFQKEGKSSHMTCLWAPQGGEGNSHNQHSGSMMKDVPVYC